MKNLITPKQISKLHALLNDSGLIEYKRQLVLEFSHNRTNSSKELTYDEVTSFIDWLEKDVMHTDQMRRKVFALAYQSGIIYGDTPEDKKMNTAKLNRFLLERGAVKKVLNKMNKQELLKTVNQFASIVKHTHESAENKEAGKEVKSLLSELNLEVK
jgi:hypothetical protein